MDVDRLIGRSWSSVRAEALAYMHTPPADLYARAAEWYAHPAWEVRFFAVLVLGRLAVTEPAALAFLFERCGDDPAYQVHEALAMAFDEYCAGVGYEQALPAMRAWLWAPSPWLRRAVSEGLRPWTATRRAYFARHPPAAIELLGTLKDDDSRAVQESVGNALRDISRKHRDLVSAAVWAWVEVQPAAQSRRIIARYALRDAAGDDPSLRDLMG